MVYGWAGSILYIDLTTGKISTRPSSEYVGTLLGGRGVNAKLLYDLSKPGETAYNPETPLIFGTGPLVGNYICANRLETTTRNPYGDLYGCVNFGGYWAPELKFAGYDHLVIKGRAAKPAYLSIDNEEIKIRNASQIWGKGIFETNAMVKEELGDPDVKILSIGIAGENLVKAATIEHEYRGGMPLGAVMGSKNLKAVSVRGTKGIKLYDPETVLKLDESLLESIRKTKDAAALNYQKHGWNREDRVLHHWDESDVGVVGNFEGHVWPDIDKARPDAFLKEYPEEMFACFGCPFPCQTFVTVPEIGSTVMNCYDYYHPWHMWLTDWKAHFEATRLFTEYGLDSKEITSLLAYLQNLYREGIITDKDTDGIPMERGSGEALIAFTHKIAKREGFGDIIAEGGLIFARKIGGKAEDLFFHQRGVSPRAVDIRTQTAVALELAVGRQHRGYGYPVVWPDKMDPEELKKAYALSKELYGTEKAVLPWEYEGKGIAQVMQEHQHANIDILGFCGTARGEYVREAEYQMHAAMFSVATGMNMDVDGLLTAAERCINIERAFQVRDGVTRKDDIVPEFFFKTPILDGPQKGRMLDKAKFEKLKGEYYEARGWDVETGKPTRTKLEALGLMDIADDLEKRGMLPIVKKARTVRERRAK